MTFGGNLFTVIVTGASMHYDDILCKKLQMFATKTSLSSAKSPRDAPAGPLSQLVAITYSRAALRRWKA